MLCWLDTMIRKISFSNFYSFKGTQTIDFTTSKKKNDNYFNTFDGKQISKVAAFVGPNNSGKTNVIKVLGFIDYFLSVPNRNHDDFDLAFKTYAFCKQQPSKFYIEFETDKKLYFYTLEAAPDRVISEVLEAKLLAKSARKYLIFNRIGNEVEVNKKIVSGVTKKSLSTIRDDISVVAFLKSGFNVGEINEVSDYFQGFRTNINEVGYVRSPEDRIDTAAEAYNKFPELKEAMEDIIVNFDLGIESFSIKKNDESLSVSAKHKVDNKIYELPMDYESRGTKSLFVELLFIVISILEGTVLALDEIESGLHPQAVDKLIQYVVDSFSEEKKQFIFTSHSLNFMKRYDPQQIFLVEKKENESEVFRLDELDIRPDENFYAKYMSGTYGAFPKIRV